MADRRRRIAGASLVAMTLLLFTPMMSSGVAGATAHVVRTVDQPPPETTEPETTTPVTTEPETTEPGPNQSDDADLTGVTIVGVIAFALLLVLASWWMIQRSDDDDAAHPRPPNLDEPLPGQDLM